ncbi:MAG: helix-turn-helix domain-containing protein [Rhizobiales bacterium]|nr:helix-turn-helix domain-containing protein [Hyphomicrobiales bacterium]
MLQQVNPARPAYRPPAFAAFGASRESQADDRLETVGHLVSRTQDQEIFSEGELATKLYKVISGSVRTFKILHDGRRQIVGFHLKGDFFGLEAADRYSVSAEAVGAAELIAMKRSTLLERASRNQNLFEKLLNITTRELSRAQAHALLLIKSAQERVQDFLLDLSERAESHEVVDLPMSRQDIADYLGLTIETVSRTLTLLEKNGLISFCSTRRIALNNRSALKALQR